MSESAKDSRLHRNWRRFYRRSRIYIPLIVVILAALIILLPIRGAWLANTIEKKLSEKTGMIVRIDNARIHLWTGEVSIQGLMINNSPFIPGFYCDRVDLFGSVGQLASGDGDYPEKIVITNPRPILFIRDENGILPEHSLIDFFTHLQKPEENQTKAKSPFSKTPEIQIKNLQIQLDDQLTTKTHPHIIFSSMSLDSRIGKKDPIKVNFEGMFASNRSKSFAGEANYLPSTKIGSLTVNLDGIDSKIPNIFGKSYEVGGNDIQLNVRYNELAQGRSNISATVTADRLHVLEEGIGGLRFIDSDVSFEVEGIIRKESPQIESWNFLTTSPSLFVEAEGAFEENTEWVGTSRVLVDQLPMVVYRTFNRWGRSHGVRLDGATTDSLRLEVALNGPFTTPEELEYQGNLRIRDWAIDLRDLPSPIELDQLNVELGTEKLTLNSLRMAYESFKLNMSGEVDQWQSPTPLAKLNLDAVGSTSIALDLLRGQNVLPPIIQDIDLPMEARLRASVPILQSEGNYPTVNWKSRELTTTGSVAWRAGEVKLELLNQPILLSGGNLKFTENDIDLSTLRAQYGSLEIDGNVELTRGETDAISDVATDATIHAKGDIPELISLINDQTGLSIARDTASGFLDTTVKLKGNLLDWENWNYDLAAKLSNGTADIKLPYTTLNLSNADISLKGTETILELPSFSVRVNDKGNFSGSVSVTDQEALVKLNATSKINLLSDIIPKEVKDMVLEGDARATVEARVIPRDPLPEAPSLVQRWLAGFQSQEFPIIGVNNIEPFQLKATGTVIPLKDVEVFHRDMPHRIYNVRGGVAVDETGFQFYDTLVDIGDAKDMKINGYVQFGHVSGPVVIDMKMEGDRLNFNDWKSGWGNREWAQRTFIVPGSANETERPEKNITILRADVKLKSSSFLSVNAEDIEASMVYNAWRKQDNTLDVNLRKASTYNGTIDGTAAMQFPRDPEDNRLRFQAELFPKQVELRLFLNDLRNIEHKVQGRVTARATLNGTVGSYPSWTGDADFRVTNSRFIGEQSFVFLTNAMNFGQEKNQGDTTVNGLAFLENEVVSFPNMQVESDQIRMQTTGTIDFDGMIDFYLTVDLFKNRLSSIPVIGRINDWVNELRNSLLSFRVTGKMTNPNIDAVPLSITDFKFFEEGRNTNQSRSSDN